MNRTLALFIPVIALLAGWGIGRVLSPVSHAGLNGDEGDVSGMKSSGNGASQLDTSNSLARKVDDFMERIRKSGNANYRDYQVALEVYEFAQTLSPAEFGPAIAQLSADKGILSYPNPAQMLSGYWMEIDPDAAKAWFERLSPEVQDEFKHGIMPVWAKMKPGEMLTWIEKQPEHRINKMFEWGAPYYTQFNTNMGTAEFEQSLTLMMKANPRDRNTNAVTGHFELFAKAFPTEAMARAMSLPGGNIRSEATMGVVRAWTAKDPEGARKWVEEGITDPALAAMAVPACADVMAQKNPKEAAEWVSSLSDSLRNQEALQSVLNKWAQNDPQEALEWVGGFPEGTNVDKYLAGVFSGMEEADPELALNTILERAGKGLSVGETRHANPGYGPYADYARMKGATEVLKIAGSIPENGAGKLDAIYSSFMTNAAQENFKETSEWVSNQKSSPRKGEAVKSLSSVLLMRDRDEAIAWTQSLPKTTDSDKARASIAGNIFRADPDTATKMYLDITDSKTGRSNLKNNTQRWINADRLAAETWLNKTSAFSAAEKTELLQKGAGK